MENETRFPLLHNVEMFYYDEVMKFIIEFLKPSRDEEELWDKIVYLWNCNRESEYGFFVWIPWEMDLTPEELEDFKENEKVLEMLRLYEKVTRPHLVWCE